jgi:flagellar biosynthetic protein FliQ
VGEAMDQAQVMDFALEAIYVLLIVSTPLMLVGLVVGLAVAIVQALTQIQEITLTFVPKIIFMFLAMLVLLPFMMERLLGFMGVVANRIAALG